MIEELLHRQLCEDEVLSGVLARYGGEPGVFYQKAPMDLDPAWEGMSFPRVSYNLDFSYDAERKQAGTLSLDVWLCALNVSGDGRNLERVLAERLEQLISGVFYSPLGESSLCAVWRDTVAFVGQATAIRREASPVETYGLSLCFDLLAFPCQESMEPDPVSALNHWAKERFPQCRVLGLDDLPEVWRPSDWEPALYWRMAGADVLREMYACTWYLGQFCGHLSCGTVSERNRFARALLEALRGGVDLQMGDGSPLRVEKSLYRHDGNPLSEGQIALWGEFGVLSSRYTELSGGNLLQEATVDGFEIVVKGSSAAL